METLSAEVSAFAFRHAFWLGTLSLAFMNAVNRLIVLPNESAGATLASR